MVNINIISIHPWSIAEFSFHWFRLSEDPFALSSLFKTATAIKLLPRLAALKALVHITAILVLVGIKSSVRNAVKDCFKHGNSVFLTFQSLALRRPDGQSSFELV